MAVIGARALLERGYSPAHVYALEAVSAQIGRDVTIRRSGGSTYLSWDYPGGGTGSQSFHRSAGIADHGFDAGKGVWDVMEPGFVKGRLTENEVMFVLPISRPHGEQISFNPAAQLGKEVGKGTYFYPESQQRKGEFSVRPIKREDVKRIIHNLQAGKVVELWRFGEEIVPKPQPTSRAFSVSQLKRRPPTGGGLSFFGKPFGKLLGRGGRK